MASIKDIVHAWATQSCGSRSSGNSVSFIGRHLHSWGTAIAYLADDLVGRQCALVSSNRWSDSTSRAQNLAIGICREEGKAVFIVPRLGAAADDVQKNIDWYTAQIADAIRAFDKGRAASVAHHREAVRQIIETAEDYAFRFQPERKTWKWQGLLSHQLQHRSEV